MTAYWTHRLNTAGGAFWCYAKSLEQALSITGGAADRVQRLANPIALR